MSDSIRKIVFFLLIMVNSLTAGAQFFASQDGAWILGTTWGGGCSSGCVAGTDYPGSLDDAYTEGHKITISGSSVSVNNLYVYFNVVDGVKKTGLGTTTLTINGELSAYTNTPVTDYAVPTVAVINPNFNIVFTGNANGGLPNVPYVIYPSGWSSVSPLKSVTFNPPSPATTLGTGDFSLISAGTMTVQSGTMQLDGVISSVSSSSATITVNSGTTLFVNSGNIVGNGGATSSFPAVTVNGTLTSASNNSSYINASTFALNSGAILNIGFNGSNQTQGWWYQSSSPSNLSTALNASSTVSYQSSSSQNVFATNYGNLFLDASAKTVSGSSTLNISGNLTINSSSVTFNSDASSGIFIGGNVVNNGTWSPADNVAFNGSGAQSLSGTSATTTYNGGITANKSAGTLTLNKNIALANDLTITSGTLDLGSRTVTFSGGNIDNSATLTPSSSTVVINGTTSVVGSAATTLYNLTVGSSGNFTGSNGLTVNGTFTNGGTVTAPTGTMNFGGNFTNNGTFNSNNGTITFNGATTQSIAGSATTSFNKMNISSTAGGVSVNGNANLSGVLTLTSNSAIFDADGSGSGVFTVKSPSVNSGGQIAALPVTGNFSGNVTIERFINGPDDWRYLSMPITNGNVGLWKANFPVTGNFSDPSPVGVNGVVSSSAASIYYYNATTGAYVAVGSGGSTSSTALSNTVGYTAYSYISSDFTISVRGTIGKGGISIPLGTGGTGVNQGYNLIPNPYPSTIDWDNITILGGMSSSMSIRTANNVFSAYVQGGAATNPPFSGWAGEIATGQSFWVKSTGASSLALTESAKTANNFQFLRTTAPQNLVRIALIGSTQRDEAVIWFQPNATDTVDNAFDALKRKNGNYVSGLGANDYVNISSYVQTSATDFAINGIAPIGCNKSVKLKIADTPVGSYKIMFSDLSTLNLGYNIQLLDHYLGTQVTVKDSLQYTFAVTSNASSFGDSRFELVFTPPTISLSAPAASVSNQCDPGSLPINLNAQAGVQYKYSINGVIVSDSVSGTGQPATITIDKSKLTAGPNSLDLIAATQGGCTTTTFANALSYSLEAIPNLPKVLGDSVCKSAKAVLTANGAPSDGSYLWYDSINSAVPIPGATSNTLQTDTLAATTSYYVSAANAYGCQSARALVTATVITVPQPTINKAGTTLSSSTSSGNQWLLEGAPITGATGQQFTPTKSGSYSVVVSSYGCSNVSDTVDVVLSITGIENYPNDILKAYPNPVKDKLQLEMPSGFNQIRIYDVQGRVMDTFQPSVQGAPVSLQIDLSNYAKGLYLLNLMTGNKNYTFKIIKE